MIEKKILPLASPVSHVEWQDNRFWVTECREWNGLSVGREHRRPANPAEVEGRLGELAFDRWDWLLATNQELALWLARLRFLIKFDEKWKMPDEEKLREALDLACFGESSLDRVAAKNLVPYFENLLETGQREALNRECPSHWRVPTGNAIRIQYSEEQGPQVEVRLQELFGLKSAPLVAGMPLTLVLLAPNYRPVQVTRDLPSFWKNGYLEVRKELRARYPKHSWPENPLTAAPQAKGRPRQ
jgi:ATP-dependent helicase HrpB